MECPLGERLSPSEADGDGKTELVVRPRDAGDINVGGALGSPPGVSLLPNRSPPFAVACGTGPAWIGESKEDNDPCWNRCEESSNFGRVICMSRLFSVS